MKKFTALLLTAVIITSVFKITTAYAASASVSFSGPYKQELLAGKTYTINYTFKVSGVCVANANVSVGGVFEKVSGGANLFHDSLPKNKTKSYKGSIKVRVKAGAAKGAKGTIKLSGYYNYLDANYNETKKSFSKTYTAAVVDKLTPRPVNVKEPTQWEKAADKIALADDGGVIDIDITDAKVPASVLDNITKKKAVLNLKFPGYSCRVDGNKFKMPKGLKTLDLTLSMEKTKKLSDAAGGADAYQLHFGHKGMLPGPVTFTIKANNNVPGDKLYLYYYYDLSDKIEEKLSSVVDQNGDLEFTILHCSSYFLSNDVIEGALGVFSTADDGATAQIKELESAVALLEDKLKAEAEKRKVEQKQQADQQSESDSQTVPISQQTNHSIGRLEVSIIEFSALIVGALMIGIIGTILISQSSKKAKNANKAKAPSDI